MGTCTIPDSFIGYFGYCSYELLIIKISTACILLLVVGGSYIHYLNLNKGISAIAGMLGGKKIRSDTKDLKEKRLLNVVEEISIAAGCPVPETFVIQNDFSLNALAAGDDINHSMVAITEGLLQECSREELQVVMAHEIGHIVGEDIKLNKRLLILLSGISMISSAGAQLYSTLGVQRTHRYRSRGIAHANFLGGLIFIIGYVGLFISRILKAAISRQREYHADATAIEFTRNPYAMATILKRIFLTSKQSSLNEPAKENFSHMFFSNIFKEKKYALLSTHPPIEKRIKKLDPSFKAKTYKRNYHQFQNRNNSQESSFLQFHNQSGPRKSNFSQEVFHTEHFFCSKSLKKSREFLNTLNPLLKRLIHDPQKSPWIIQSLFLSATKSLRNTQIMKASPKNFIQRKYLEIGYQQTSKLSLSQRVLLLELATPYFKDQASQDPDYIATISQLISLNNRKCPEDYLSQQIIRQTLSNRPAKKTKKNLSVLGEDLCPLIFFMIYVCWPKKNLYTKYEKIIKSFKWIDVPSNIPPSLSDRHLQGAIRSLLSIKDNDLEYFCRQVQHIIFTNAKDHDYVMALHQLLNLCLNIPSFDEDKNSLAG